MATASIQSPIIDEAPVPSPPAGEPVIAVCDEVNEKKIADQEPINVLPDARLAEPIDKGSPRTQTSRVWLKASPWIGSCLVHGALLAGLMTYFYLSRDDAPPGFSLERGSGGSGGGGRSGAMEDFIEYVPVAIATLPVEKPAQPPAELTSTPAATIKHATLPIPRAIDDVGPAPSPPDDISAADVVRKSSTDEAPSPKTSSLAHSPSRASHAASRLSDAQAHADDLPFSDGFGGNGGAVDALPGKHPANPQPPYPAAALAAGLEGVVYLRVLVSAEGTVERASIHQSSGALALDESALTTVRNRWRFTPARRDGRPVPYEFVLPIRFHISR